MQSKSAWPQIANGLLKQNPWHPSDYVPKYSAPIDLWSDAYLMPSLDERAVRLGYPLLVIKED